MNFILRSRRRTALVSVLVLAVVLLVAAYLEGDLPQDIIGLRAFATPFLARYGTAGSALLLYVEESGVPLPVPGDVYVIYLGRTFAGSPERLVLAWLLVIFAVTAGATNLFWISRRWGTNLIEHRLAGYLHIDQKRVAAAERWLDRWGPLAIIFGRHIPGLRIPITVVAGSFKVKYGHFAPSVAVSTAIWAGAWMFFGARYAPQLFHLMRGARNLYLVLVVVGAVVIAAILVSLWRSQSDHRV